jgi:hypothetical protein
MFQTIAQPELSGQEHSSYSNNGSALPAWFAPLIPYRGASLCTIAGSAKTLARVFLAPGSGLSKRHRDLADAHPIVCAAIRGDSYSNKAAPSPRVFHQPTVRWMLRQAHHVAIWSAPFPQFSDDLARWSLAAIEEGSLFGVTIETTPARVGAWERLVRQWRQPASRVRVFGPTGEDYLQAGRVAAEASYRSLLKLLD